jgi:hypothetical protein
MARAEAVIGSQLLLAAFPDLSLEPDADVAMTITGQTRSLPHLPVVTRGRTSPG